MVALNPNTCREHQGEHLQDYGFDVFAASESYHGNLPTVYAKSPTGELWEFDGPMHIWIPLATQLTAY